MNASMGSRAAFRLDPGGGPGAQPFPVETRGLMETIATLTLNPTIDASYAVERMVHTHKMRGLAEHYDPGGGGINVARVFVRLGGTARCYYLAGGATGVALDGLIDRHQLVREKIAIAGETRIAAAVFEQASGKEYRIVPPGPEVAEAEWRACLERLEQVNCAYLVASGSLPPGVPDDFYARIGAVARARGARLVLDSSGRGLTGGLAEGGVHLVKPSLGELQQAVGRSLETDAEIEAAAAGLVAQGRAEIVAATLGHRGAVLASRAGTLRLPAIQVEAASSVGAGDSFLAAMVFALSRGETLERAFRSGLAAGAAAVLAPGTSLAHPDDIARLGALG